MKRTDRIEGEFGRPPEEFPVIREYDAPPLEEDFARPAASDAPEYQNPAPEITEPGKFPYDAEAEEKKSRRFRRKLMMLAGAAAVFFLLFEGPLKSRVSAGPPKEEPAESTADVTPAPEPEPEPEPEPAPEPVVYTDIESEDGEPPFIGINYAVRVGNVVRYQYNAIPWYQGDLCQVEVERMIYGPESGYEVHAEDDPDVWVGSRDWFEYEIPVDVPDGEKLQLVVTGHYTVEGEEKLIRAVKDVVDLPPEPETSATATMDGDQLSFEGFVLPQAGDGHEYDLVARDYGFHFRLFDEAGTYLGGGLVYEEVKPEAERGASGGYRFVYDGPADLTYPDNAVEWSVALEVTDQSTGYPYFMETERHPIVRRTYVEPECDITAYNFSSEMHADIRFSGMDDVTGVTLEVWDPNTDYMDSSTDITREAVEDLIYHVPGFSTDGIYQANQSYYGQPGVDFPMTVEFRVIIDYESETGPRTVTYSATTSPELGFYVKYLPDSEAVYSEEYSSCVYLGTEPSPDYPTGTVYFDQPEKVTEPGIISISAEIDGEPVPASAFSVKYSEMDLTFGSGVTTRCRVGDVLMKRPADIKEGEGKSVTLYVTHYMLSTGGPYTTEMVIPFEAHE